MKRWPWVVGVALAATAVFSPGLAADFSIYDDALYIVRPVMEIPGLTGLRAVWDATPSWTGNFIEFFPLRDTVYWTVRQLFGEHPLAFHVVSLAFHILASILVGLFAESLGVRRTLAALTALVFALHPIHTESALWIAGLKDPMCMSFILLCLLAFQRYRKDNRARWYGLSLVALVAALLVKSVAFVTPGIMALLLLLTEPRRPLREVLKLCIGPAIIAGIFLVQFLMIGKLNSAIIPPHGGSWTTHFILAAWAQVLYLKQALFPSDFQLVYCHFPALPPWDYRLWVSISLALALGLLTWRLRHNRRYLLLLGWYALFLLPVSNLVPFPALMADRYLYYSSFSVCLGFALLIGQFPKLRFTVVPLVLVLGWVSFERSHAWLDEELLWYFAASDPACMEDTMPPASQVHMAYATTATDVDSASNAILHLMFSAGLARTPHGELCRNIPLVLARILDVGPQPKNETLGHFLAVNCSFSSQVWYNQALIHAGRLPLIAAQSAGRAFSLDRSPEKALLYAISRVSLGDTTPANFIPAIILDYQTEGCKVLDTWLKFSPMDAIRFERSVAICKKTATVYEILSALVRREMYPSSRKYRDPRYWAPINFYKSKPNKT